MCLCFMYHSNKESIRDIVYNIYQHERDTSLFLCHILHFNKTGMSYLIWEIAIHATETDKLADF